MDSNTANVLSRYFPVIGGVVGLLFVAGLLALTMWGVPVYRVWQREKSGQAQLAEADWNRQIQIREANAQLESSKFLADAEIERARGVAEANRIIAEGLGGPQGYLHYLWVQTLRESDNALVYVPTEAQLPLLEAGRETPR